MKFSQPLIPGILLKRYKRFLADIELADGTVVTAHCPNTGSMLGCNIPGSEVYLSPSQSPKRKLAYTWELVRANNVWVGINTMKTNHIVYEGITQNLVPELKNYTFIKKEKKLGENSRIDIYLEKDDQQYFIEIKNVTLAENGVALFPDAVTQRGTKHLRELITAMEHGHRGMMFYLVQRADTQIFKPAEKIDPVYAKTLAQAIERGLSVLVYQADVTPEELKLGKNLPASIRHENCVEPKN